MPCPSLHMPPFSNKMKISTRTTLCLLWSNIFLLSIANFRECQQYNWNRDGSVNCLSICCRVYYGKRSRILMLPKVQNNISGLKTPKFGFLLNKKKCRWKHLSSILAWASTYDNAAHDLITLLVYLVEIISASGVISWNTRKKKHT